MTDLFDFYPYAERYGVTRALLEHGPPAGGDPRAIAGDGRLRG